MNATEPAAVRIGVHVPFAGPNAGEWLADAAAYEAAGADSLWLSEAPFRAADDKAGPQPALEAWTLLAAVAAVTHRVRLGTALSVVATWPPALLASVVATLEHLSRGRVIVGVGAGEEPVQFSAVGLDFSSREARLDDHLAALRHLWGTPSEPFAGTFYQLPPLKIAGGVRGGGPPVFVGGVRETDFQRAAQLAEGFVHPGDQPEAVSWAFDRIRELRNEAGRPAHFELWVRVPPPTDRQAWRETIASYASAGATGVLVEAGPRLLDTLRNPDVDIDRDDLHLAQG